ncbi:hypothetical protein [Variovorax sp. PAMC26660]|uniref:hypothetical protein n=1 Tax=Variovorax sp. PAMC26660 TaxID=2762322 RepID=UPI00164E7102|nr:hypothetical protein [Variovorax sp. PAMC26660]QNK68079.1 hypothetical protein H7F35_34055 [Variovorax sp. PAMC26660]
MPTLNRFQKESALRASGVKLRPYPLARDATGGADQRAADLEFLHACTAWEDDIDKLYLQQVLAQPPARTSDGIQAFVATCEQQGVAAALAQLNRGVPHRYTAVYRLEGEMLKNIALFDKAGEDRPEFLAEVPLGTSFCQFVLRDGSFLTSDSAKDDRLNGHPYKGVMVAYHGVPVLNETGTLFGSLCHFDVQAQPLSDVEFERLKFVAGVIRPYLK